MTTAPTKNRTELRQTIREKRQGLSSDDQTQAAVQLSSSLAHHPKVKHAKNIALYLTNDGELNTQPFIDYCWQNNIKTYLPVIHPFSKGHLLFLRYHEQSIMRKNKYHILEPQLNVCDVLPVAQIDIIFTPLVAFDQTGARLGMGGGYYDRTLSTWFTQKEGVNKPYPIGLAYDCQEVAKVPTEHWDIPIPEIITPTKQYQFFSC
ncbi:5-formyltetrahydrofolate cyclo-ligase [Colwelliaceae bacterium 6441]